MWKHIENITVSTKGKGEPNATSTTTKRHLHLQNNRSTVMERIFTIVKIETERKKEVDQKFGFKIFHKMNAIKLGGK